MIDLHRIALGALSLLAVGTASRRFLPGPRWCGRAAGARLAEVAQRLTIRAEQAVLLVREAVVRAEGPNERLGAGQVGAGHGGE